MSKFEKFPLDYEVISASSGFSATFWKELSSAHNTGQGTPFLDSEDQFSIGTDEFAIETASGGFSQPDTLVAEVKSEGAYVGNPPDISSTNDARFAEMVDILEEFDLEIKNSLQALTQRCEQLSETYSHLASFTSEIREHNIAAVNRLHEEIQKSASVEMLSEMFLAIDSKIGELTDKINSKTAKHERAIDELEKKYASVFEKTSILEDRMAKQEQKSLTSQEEVSKVLADGLK